MAIGELDDGSGFRVYESRVRHFLCRRNERLVRYGPGHRHRVAATVRRWNEAHSSGRSGGCTVSASHVSFLQVLARWVALADRYRVFSKVFVMVFGRNTKVLIMVMAFGSEDTVLDMGTFSQWYDGDGSGILNSVRYWIHMGLVGFVVGEQERVAGILRPRQGTDAGRFEETGRVQSRGGRNEGGWWEELMDGREGTRWSERLRVVAMEISWLQRLRAIRLKMITYRLHDDVGREMLCMDTWLGNCCGGGNIPCDK
ncbi:hypothetical protein V6N13_142419 [Hibiscus sabdariffa]|uniref:Uncharacterized protein n=1 Tax=Hibiscus sabdariffa TaxID=183260 RepID=A0ABR2FEL0_9ROSI